jgi:hypothetical protein
MDPGVRSAILGTIDPLRRRKSAMHVRSKLALIASVSIVIRRNSSGHRNQMEAVRWSMTGCGDVAEMKGGPGFYKVDHSALVAVDAARR